MIDLILSQGRIADRKDGTIEGAKLTADTIQSKFGLTLAVCGKPSPAVYDNWKQSLSASADVLSALENEITKSLGKGNTPCLIANTCSSSFASLPLVSEYYEDAKILWVDAHGDFNTPETSTSGYLGGMVLSGVCGVWDSGRRNGVNPKNVILAGVRDLEEEEKKLLLSRGVTTFSAEEFCAEKILASIGSSNVWVHIDWDVLEPGYIPADYSVPGGLLPHQIKQLLSLLSQKILGLEVTEFIVEEERDYSVEVENIIDTLSPFFKEKR